MDRPLPGGEDVETRFADVPSARGLHLWQQGRRDGLRYVISADLTARITPGPGRRDWAMVLECSEGGATCTRDRVGIPPASARALASVLERCLAGAPLEVAVTEPVQIPVQTAPPEPCGVATVETGPTPAHTLQRLLATRDDTVGAVDGLIGPRTVAALERVAPGGTPEPFDAAAALDVVNGIFCAPE